MSFILLLFVVIIIFTMVKNKIKIDLPSFAQKSLPLSRGIFGVYCFTGKQGTGKTYSLNKYIRKHARDKKLYSNVTLFGIEYTKLTTIQQLLALSDEKDCVIVYDEIFTFMTKQTKWTDDTLEFLSQMRKQHNIFITTAQEWLVLPIDFRRYVRVQIECTTRPLGKWGGILFEEYYDATNIKWDNLENEYVSPIISKKLSKYEKRYMILYDTEERIRPLAK